MLTNALLRMTAVLLALGVTARAWAAAPATLDAPASVPAGSAIKITWTGPGGQWDRIGIAPASAPDRPSPDTPQSTYATGNAVTIVVPDEPGTYEVRYFSSDPRTVLARRKVTVLPVTARLEAPASAIAGSSVNVKWTGPNNGSDRIYVVNAGAPEHTQTDVSVPVGPNPVPVTVPDAPGAYELRYVTAQSHISLARAPLTVTGATATITGPASAIAGSAVNVKWTGPNNGSDRIYVVKAGAPEHTPTDLSVPVGDNPARVTVPDVPGAYEFRYVTAQSHTTLARAPVTVTGTTATIKGPGTATAGTYFSVSWTGPGNDYDYITVSPKGSTEDRWANSSAVNHQSPTPLRAPLVAGAYELRYHTGQTHATLARDDLRVTPTKEEPGLVRVNAAQGVPRAGGAVEIILDASGSMLQHLGSKRRIDIAKSTLKNLTSKVIPAGTPFALRVFGRRPNSCETELDIPAHPLDPAAVAKKVDALTAKSKAKTPIAASLEKVADDLSSVSGERLVILVTDGEETCGGDPARTIQHLMKRGIDVRINIVGFAVDDRKTAAMFRQWSSAGGGAYFDAKSAASLNDAFSLAVKARFEIVDAQKKVVADGLVGGEPVSVLPGEYTVRVQGRSLSVTVQPKKTSDVSL